MPVERCYLGCGATFVVRPSDADRKFHSWGCYQDHPHEDEDRIELSAADWEEREEYISSLAEFTEVLDDAEYN